MSKLVSVPLATGLFAIGALHVLWARSSWPYESGAELARHVVGTGTGMPPAAACVAVGAGLIGAGYVVLALDGRAPRIGPNRLYQFGGWTLTAVMLGRGLLGPLTHIGATDEYIVRDWFLYSPLCLALGALSFTLMRRSPRNERTAELSGHG